MGPARRIGLILLGGLAVVVVLIPLGVFYRMCHRSAYGSNSLIAMQLANVNEVAKGAYSGTLSIFISNRSDLHTIFDFSGVTMYVETDACTAEYPSEQVSQLGIVRVSPKTSDQFSVALGISSADGNLGQWRLKGVRVKRGEAGNWENVDCCIEMPSREENFKENFRQENFRHAT